MIIMNKLDIFKDVADIMMYDASSCKDVAGANTEKYERNITRDMPDEEFLFLVNSYLNTFGLTGHLSFGLTGFGGILFRVQRYEDMLYVTDSAKNCILQKGDIITGIDGMSVSEYGKRHAMFLFDEIEERQAPHWVRLLKFAKKVTYIRKQNRAIQEYEIQRGHFVSPEKKYDCRRLSEKSTLLRLADFGEEDQIQHLYAENADLLKNTRNLIVDVRNNDGGSDTCFLPLLQYALPNGQSLKQVYVDDGVQKDGSEINYSERNCELRLQTIREYLKMDLSQDTLDVINTMKQNLENHKGMGFCATEDDSMEIPVVGDSLVEKVYIITDSGCGSSGDNFVYMFGMLPKVTVVGRPTMGILDYSNVAFVKYDDFTLMYPTSRLSSLDHGKGMMRHGVPVDVYVPWTPKHLERDVDLEAVLNMI